MQPDCCVAQNPTAISAGVGRRAAANVLPDRGRQAQRHQPAALSRRPARPHRRPAGSPHTGACARPTRAKNKPWATLVLARYSSARSCSRCRSQREARLDLMAQQLVRYAVVMLDDLDMIVEADPAALPLGVLVRDRWQRYECWPVELFVKHAPGDAPAAHQAIIEIVEQSSDRRIKLGQRQERRCRSRANIQRPTTCTPTSTLAS